VTGHKQGLQQHFPTGERGSAHKDIAIDDDTVQVRPSLKHPVHLPQHLRIQPLQQSFQRILRPDQNSHLKAIAFAAIISAEFNQLVSHPNLRRRIDVPHRQEDFWLWLLFCFLCPGQGLAAPRPQQQGSKQQGKSPPSKGEAPAQAAPLRAL
jgi:hypothetical protein